MELKEIYQQIPQFKCKDGCTDCCGPVPFTKEEWDKVEDKRVAKNIDCPYSTEEKCDIYKDRPFMCRIFGASTDLLCPHNCRPLNLLTEEKTRELTSQYMELFN